MSYPNLPKIIPNPTSGTPAKLPKKQLTDYYNELVRHNFAVVAKRRTGKSPVQKWKELSRKELSPQYQLQLQEEPYASGWCILTGSRSDRLVVIDLDFADIAAEGHDPEEVYKQFQELSPCEYVIATPTGGVHLYYRTPEGKPVFGSKSGVGFTGVDIRGDNGLVASLGGFNRYTDNHEKKGVVYNHEAAYTKLPDGNYETVPTMSDALYDHLTSLIEVAPKLTGVNFGTDEMVRNFQHTEIGNAKLENHFKQTLSQREAIVIECLDVVFKKWGSDMSNDEWTQVWMSAFHGAPTVPVRDFIINHADVYWSDGAHGKSMFAKRWLSHVWQEGGYTVASLFWIAKRAGWLEKTGYEIPDTHAEEINVRFISDWLETEHEVPPRILIESQTGSGKTYAIKQLWERVGCPRTVIFVPTVKLATELAHSLQRQGMPAVLYRDEEKNRHIGVDNMKAAKVLVTTLQTFATKLYQSGVPLKNYGLVYIEEIDQLLAGFARGGGGMYQSHVSEIEARLGFKVIREAYRDVPYVWGVDATMSQVSYALAVRMSLDTVRMIRNVYIHRKPTVTFLKDYDSAYQVIYDSLRAGKKVVAICDTANKAVETHKLMLQLKAVTKENSIVITRHTSTKKEVIEFMQDVDAGASHYQLVVYNSIMGSGVSITKVVPDVVVQMAHYLTPRNNLQMLNRYRKQNEVYCYYQPNENLYAKSAHKILDEVRIQLDVESQLVKLPLSARTDDAVLRDYVAGISIADEQAQRRSPKQFYQTLLAEDGRSVKTEDVSISGVVEYSIKKVREIQKKETKYIAANWHLVRPITEENPPDPNMSNMEVALGLHHGLIHRALRGNVPIVQDTERAEYVSKVVKTMRPYSFPLSEFMMQEHALTRAERHLIDGDKALTAINANISKIKAVALVGLLYPDMKTVVSAEDLEAKSREFVNQVVDKKELYDSVVMRSHEKFEKVYNPNDVVDSAMAFSKILLRQIGLRQTAKRTRTDGLDRRKIYISNIQEAEDYLKWRYADYDFKFNYTFSTDIIDDAIIARQSATDLFRKMTEEEQREVTRKIMEDSYSFQQAVNWVASDLKI